MSSRPDCIFENHQLWQSGFSRVYCNCCCSCSFVPEIIKIIKIGQSSHKMYSNNIMNFQESKIILDSCTKKSGNLLNSPRACVWIYSYMCICDYRCIYKFVYMCVCVCVSVCIYQCLYVCMYIYICVYMYMRVYVYIYVYMYIYVHICMCCLSVCPYFSNSVSHLSHSN